MYITLYTVFNYILFQYVRIKKLLLLLLYHLIFSLDESEGSTALCMLPNFKLRSIIVTII